MIIAIALIALAAVAVVGISLRAVHRSRRQGAHLTAELARTRALAAAQERRRRAAFEHLPIAALRVGAMGRISEINALAREKFPHAEVGAGILASFGEHRFAGEVAAALESGQQRNLEVRLFSDERRTFRVSIEPLAVDGTTEALIFLADFTDAVAYQELRIQFSANVSHELRTPLTGLAGLIEALGDPEMDPETHRRFVERATSEIQRLVALISDVLFLSELEATTDPGPPARSDLRAAITGAVDALGDVAAEHGVTIEVSADRELWTPLNERMATTVVQNLIENAIKYGGPGSQTVVEARHIPDGDRVELICRDSGPGIPERHLPHIFERFYRADASRSKRLGGTGLGLSIVKHIAERFGGAVDASSREGFGTTIVVRLPAAPPTSGAGGEPSHEDVSFSTTR